MFVVDVLGEASKPQKQIFGGSGVYRVKAGGRGHSPPLPVKIQYTPHCHTEAL